MRATKTQQRWINDQITPWMDTLCNYRFAVMTSIRAVQRPTEQPQSVRVDFATVTAVLSSVAV